MTYWTSTILLNSYKLNRDYNYQFNTEAGLEYNINLNDYLLLSGIPDPGTCGLMFLSVVRKKKLKCGKDSSIRDTIIALILDFFRRNNNDIIYYVCDNANKKAYIRLKLFHKWFNNYNYGNFCYESRFVKGEECIFIFSQGNNSAKRFISWFDERSPK